MPPALQHPSFGLSTREEASARRPVFLIDAAAGLLLDANLEGWKAWGLDPAPAAPPIGIDCAMPALQRLRAMLSGGADADRASEPTSLVFWTARGVLSLECRVEVTRSALATATLVRALETNAADAAILQPTVARANGATPPDVALSATLAHELRTPLSAVIAYAEILKDEHFGPLANARYRGYARDIYESARHALGVVDGMLRGDAARTGVPRLAFAELDPAGVVESCLSVARPLAERAGLELGTTFAPRLPRIIADDLSLKQMLLNLLANAIKYARRGDRVMVTVAHDAGGPLTIAVADTGPGMGPGMARLAGDAPAQPGSNNGSGLGIGLPLTRALATANGATLAIESAQGLGTRVTISFAKERVVPL